MNTLQDTLSTLPPGPLCMAEKVMKHGREIFHESNQVPHAIFVPDDQDSSKVDVVEIPIFNEITREAIWAVMDEVRSKYPYCGFISEVWMRKAKKDDVLDMKIRPSEAPDRIEQLMFSLWHLHRTILFTAEIHRNPKRLDEWRVFYDSLTTKIDGVSKDGVEIAGGMMGTKRYSSPNN